MNNTITKIKNGAIVLPSKIRESWQGAEVYIRISNDTMILKKLYKPSKIFNEETVKKLKSLGKKISNSDIKNAIAWSRKK